MRKMYIVSYDIRDQKRLRNVFNKMRGYGDSLQYSVFICNLSDKERAIMISELSDIINNIEDSIMIVDLGVLDPSSSNKIDMIGKTYEFKDRTAIII